MAELADALRSGRSELNAHVGSNPTFGIKPAVAGFFMKKMGYDTVMPKRTLFKKQWVLVLVFFILFITMLGLNTRISEFFRLTGQRDEMTQRIELLKGTQTALETQIAYAASDKAVEEWARTYEKMNQPGDQIIIPLPEKEMTPVISYLPSPQPEATENWQIWMELLFGD